MDDTWIDACDDISRESASDSDIIDSETEAELYSTIHYEENLNSNKIENINFLTFEQFVQNQGNNSAILVPNESIFCTKEKKENVNTQLIDTSTSVPLNCLEEKTPPNKKSLMYDGTLKSNMSPPKKLKVDSVKGGQFVNMCSEDSDLNELYGHKSLNDIHNRINNYNSHRRQFPQKKDNASLIDSSDSDSIIWAEADSSIKTDFKTNLLKNVDTIYLSSSDSDNELCISPPFKKRESILKNLSMPNIKMGEKSEGLWHINDEDLYRTRKYSRRYHDIEITCSNCSKKGHNFKTCPIPKKVKCFICGGAHLGSRCMNRMCSNCYNFGHDRKKCQRRPNNFCCTLCSVKGHIKQNCPDLWRRYHLTTQPVKIIQGKGIKQRNNLRQDTTLYCWNCGDRGHFGALCCLKFSKSLTTWPCVVSYDNPEKLLKKRLDDVKDVNDDSRVEERIHQSAHTPRRRKAHLKQFNGLNADKDIEETESQKRRRQKKKRRMKARLNQIRNILGEQDFPRTPKKNSPKKSQQISLTDTEMPESVQLSIKKQIKNRNRKFRRNWRCQQRKSEVNTQNLQAVI